MSLKAKISLAIAIFLWASAFVAIRYSLQDYSPEGLALFRYLIASSCMALIYFKLHFSTSRLTTNNSQLTFKNIILLLATGALGIGVYNISLNYGELVVSSGTASFIISQAPILTAVLAMILLREKMNLRRFVGLIISIIGIACISLGQSGSFKWDVSIVYILIATLTSASFSLLQKPFLKQYHAIEVTTYLIWGGTLFLAIFYSHLYHDVTHASLAKTFVVIYLGIFPAAVGYLCWSYVLKEISASHATGFLYSTPFVATLLGWLCLNEIPVLLSIGGGVLAIVGVWLVNKSYYRTTQCPSLSN